VWKLINQSPITFWIGLGIGSLETSRSLGVSGITLLTSNLGVFGANSLTGLIGDFGLFGVIMLIMLLTRMALGLLLARSDQSQEPLNIGLAFFICTLPLWMFYMNVWTTSITMFFFWFGYGQQSQLLKTKVNSLTSSCPSRRFSKPIGIFRIRT
jgi:hypothetical protein